MDIRALYITKPPKCALTCLGDLADDLDLEKQKKQKQDQAGFLLSAILLLGVWGVCFRCALYVA
jgi:hypothetical protein